MFKKSGLVMLLVLVVLCAAGASSGMAQTTIPAPKISIGLDQSKSPQEDVTALQILLLLTVISLAPAILVTLTSFTRIIVVLSFLRYALGTQQTPSNPILIGLAFFMTMYIMSPVWTQINDKAVQPYLNKKIERQVAFNEAMKPIREFMFKYTREADLGLFIKAAGQEKPKNRDEVSTLSLIPAFIISELKTAFQIGFLIYIPFLIIDMVVASTLMSMGMLMLPPVMISLPFKILLFVLVDGWNLVVGSLLRGFGL
jgi:flagellar biosynthesis protein FliP